MARPSLNVISGSWISSEKWVDFPPTVRARSPSDKERLCDLRVARGDILKGADQRRRQPAYEFWSMIVGKPPPVPNREENAAEGLMSLLDAHACFKGIERPCGDDDNGGCFVAYVMKPTHFYAYEFLAPLVFTTKETVDRDLVFLVFARLDVPDGGALIKGVITHWELVEADDADPSLPVNFDTRFNQRLW